MAFNNKNVQGAVLRLFNGLLIDGELNSKITIDESVFKEFGIVVTEDIKNSISPSDLKNLFKDVYGDVANKTLFSLKQLVTLSEYERVIHTIAHYITTYGFEFVTGRSPEPGIVYIPNDNKMFETVDCKETDIAVRVIKGIDKEGLWRKIYNLYTTNTGLNSIVINDVNFIVGKFFKNKFIETFVKQTPKTINRELFSSTLAELDIIPKDGDYFVKYVISKVGAGTLSIKTKDVFNAIKEATVVRSILDKYVIAYGVEELARSWHRNRFYYLAMKHAATPSGRRMLNKARKLSTKLNEPIRKHPIINFSEVKPTLPQFRIALQEANIYRIIKLYNFLSYNTTSYDKTLDKMKLYKVRNGKVWYKEGVSYSEEDQNYFKQCMDSIKEEIKARKLFEGKEFFVPDFIDYACPTSSKDCIGGIPNGTIIQARKVSEAYGVGIHWENFDETRIDLDLNIQSPTLSISWNTDYQNEDDTIIHSGDMTDAPAKTGGATELMCIKKNCEDAATLSFNLYNEGCFSNIKNRFTYDIVLVALTKDDFTSKEKLRNSNVIFRVTAPLVSINQSLGITLPTGEYIISNYGIGKNHVMSGFSSKEELLIATLSKTAKTQLRFVEFAEWSGAKIIRSLETNKEDGNVTYMGGKKDFASVEMAPTVNDGVEAIKSGLTDLSPQNVASDTFFSLIK